MAPVNFIPADPIHHREAVFSIHLEYMSWVIGEMERTFGLSAHDIVGMSVADYVASVTHKVCGEQPPQGVFYLVELDGQVAAMGGLRSVHAGVAEVKRLYVRPAYRGRQLGELVLQKLMTDARRFGYQSVCLDTALFMHSAHRLYEAHGFVDCAAYEGVEVLAQFQHNWRFMHCEINSPDG